MTAPEVPAEDATPSPVRRTTPDALGYLVAVLVAEAVTVVGLVLVQLAGSRTSVLGVIEALVVGSVYVGLVSMPLAPVGVVVVHLACRRVEHQSVHVVAAGVAGLGAGLAVAPLAVGVAGLHYLPWLPVAVMVGCAVGRAAVIGMRPRRGFRRTGGGLLL